MSLDRYGIFLPVRNGAAYVAQAIDSVLSQTCDDWSLYVLDNASTDGSAEIAAAYRHPRIHVRRSDADLSIHQSWHRVWSLLAEGQVQPQYVTILGHDDLLRPGFLHAIGQLIQQHPTASLYQTHFDMLDEHGRLIRPCRPVPAVESAADFVSARLWGLRDSVGTGYVFRSSDYVRVGGMPDLPFLLYADDLLFGRLASLSFKASSRDSHCSYRLHRGSSSRRLTTERIEGQLAALESYIDRLPEEFPELMESSVGRSGLACLLAREVMILGPLANRLLLQPQTCDRLHRLSARYHASAAGIDYRQWLGTNFVSRELYPWSKQLMLFFALLGGKLMGAR